MENKKEKMIKYEIRTNPFEDLNGYANHWKAEYGEGGRGYFLINAVLNVENNIKSKLSGEQNAEDIKLYEEMAELFEKNDFKADAEHVRFVMFKMEKWIENVRQKCVIEFKE